MVTIKHTTTIDVNVERGVSYTGLLDSNELKEKLQGNFSLVLASGFPMYKCFPELNIPKSGFPESGKLGFKEHKVDYYYYEPPANITARKAATLDKSIGNLLLSNLPGWVALPERETSAMVYSSIQTANGFLKKSSKEDENYPGRMYRAVPELNSKLVIAPTAHIRFSFQYALEQFGITKAEYGPLGKFHGCFYQLFRAYGMEDGFPMDWQLFLTTLHDIVFEKIRPWDKITG